MWKRRKLWLNHVLADKADDGTGGGSGGGSGGDGGGDGVTPKVSDKEAALLKEVMAKKDALKKAEDERQAAIKAADEAKNIAKKFEGVDLDKYQAMLKAEKDAEEDKLKKAGEWEQMKARLVDEKSREIEQIVTQHKSEYQKLQEQIDAAKAETKKHQSLVEDLTIGQAFSSSKFVQEKLVPAAPKVRKLFGEYFEIEEGKPVAYDKPRGYESRTKLVDGEGKSLSFDLALEKIVGLDPDKDTLIRAAIKQGAGSGTNNQEGGKSTEKEVGSGLSRISGALREMKFEEPKPKL